MNEHNYKINNQKKDSKIVDLGHKELTEENKSAQKIQIKTKIQKNDNKNKFNKLEEQKLQKKELNKSIDRLINNDTKEKLKD